MKYPLFCLFTLLSFTSSLQGGFLPSFAPTVGSRAQVHTDVSLNLASTQRDTDENHFRITILNGVAALAVEKAEPATLCWELRNLILVNIRDSGESFWGLPGEDEDPEDPKIRQAALNLPVRSQHLPNWSIIQEDGITEMHEALLSASEANPSPLASLETETLQHLSYCGPRGLDWALLAALPEDLEPETFYPVELPIHLPGVNEESNFETLLTFKVMVQLDDTDRIQVLASHSGESEGESPGHVHISLNRETSMLEQSSGFLHLLDESHEEAIYEYRFFFENEYGPEELENI